MTQPYPLHYWIMAPGIQRSTGKRGAYMVQGPFTTGAAAQRRLQEMVNNREWIYAESLMVWDDTFAAFARDRGDVPLDYKDLTWIR